MSAVLVNQTELLPYALRPGAEKVWLARFQRSWHEARTLRELFELQNELLLLLSAYADARPSLSALLEAARFLTGRWRTT